MDTLSHPHTHPYTHTHAHTHTPLHARSAQQKACLLSTGLRDRTPAVAAAASRMVAQWREEQCEGSLTQLLALVGVQQDEGKRVEVLSFCTRSSRGTCSAPLCLHGLPGRLIGASQVRTRPAPPPPL